MGRGAEVHGQGAGQGSGSRAGVGGVRGQQPKVSVSLAQVAAQQQESATTQKAEREVSRMVVVMVGSFCLCYVPYAALAMYMVNNREHGIDLRLVTVPAFFSKSSCVYNPIIYCFMNKQVTPVTPGHSHRQRTRGEPRHMGEGHLGHMDKGDSQGHLVMGAPRGAQGYPRTRDTQGDPSMANTMGYPCERTPQDTRMRGIHWQGGDREDGDTPGHWDNGDMRGCPRTLRH